MRKYSLGEHLNELKNRLLFTIAFFLACFGLCYYYSDYLYKIILSPLISVIGSDNGRKIIYTGLTEAFFAYIKLAVFFASLASFPLVCYQFFAFLRPGLYPEEKKILGRIIFIAPLLFYLGCGFMFYIVMPQAWLFFMSYEQGNIGIPLVLEARISEYLSLVMQLSFAFGLSFELPVVMMIFTLLGFISSHSLKKSRRVAIVLIFIVAAIFTPPDVFSQIALAIPLVLLYEISIRLCMSLENRERTKC